MLTRDDVEEILLLKKYLASEFEIKHLGNLKYFLGNEVARSKDGIFICHRKYALDLLKETRMLGSKACDIPLEPNLKLCDDSVGAIVDRGSYQRLLGKIIYLAHSHLDIAIVITAGLYFPKHDRLGVEAYTDADWAGSIIYRRSTSGYYTFVGGNLVTWRSKK
ncbi:uncharacterized protein LOC114291938 [Camellia sinensis]|uniref:uncharacterized protein LOC114291938 n=1 Tax=Camellia sinensis TaxID=4442 RepID=UPI00103601B3|nr:uncharacterized protein LOC114291938 [Camellia sinensis]